MNPSILFLLLLFSVLGLQQRDEPGKLVDEIVDRFEKIAESSADLVEKLKLIKESTAAFLKLATPLGALLAASLDITHKTESDDFKALKKLSTEMHTRFDILGDMIKNSFTELATNARLREFDNLITGRLNVLERRVRRFMDPTIPKNMDSVTDLLIYCRGDNGVEGMADYMKRNIVIGCKLNNTLVFVEIEKIYYALVVEHDIRREWSYEEMGFKDAIEEIAYSVDIDIVLPVLENIREEIAGYYSFERALKEMYNSLKPLQSKKGIICLTDLVFNTNDYDRDAIKGYSDLIQYELSRLMAAAHVCANFTFPNSTSDLDAFLLSVGNNIVDTSQFLVNYIPKKLIMSAYGPEDKVVNETIMSYPPKDKSDITVENYDGLADHLGAALMHTGPAGILRQILVSHPDDEYYNTYYVCPKYWCSLIRNIRGVNVMVARFEKNRGSYVSTLRKRRDRIQNNITTQLKTDYWIPLPEFVANLSSKQNVSLVVDFERSAALIRHKISAPHACSYSSIAHKYKRRRGHDRRATVTLKYTNFVDKPFPYTDDNTCHHFFFFM